MQFDLPHRVIPQQPRNHAPAVASQDGDEEISLDELVVREREILAAALRRTNWKIYGSDGAAALLRIKPTTLVSKVKRLKLEKPTA